MCYTHSDRPIDQDPDTECHKAIRTALKMLRKDLRKLSPAQPDHSADVSKMVNGDVVSRREATQTILEFIIEYLGGAFDENLQKKLIERINALSFAEPEQRWIPCSEQMPECEQEVLICTKKKIHISKNSGLEWYEEPIITPALHEDGTMLEANSKWRWEDIDYEGWDEEEDCGIIPEGWWENRHFNQDEVYNNIVDKEVIAWMPLPEPYKERREDG